MKKKARKSSAKSPALLAKAHRMVSRLREQYALGQVALRTQKNGKSIADLAAKHGYSVNTLRKIRAFARDFSQADVEELWSSLRPNGLPLHWGYVSVLLAIRGKHGVAVRKKFQRKAVKSGHLYAAFRFSSIEPRRANF
jgi:hypothetical protein